MSQFGTQINDIHGRYRSRFAGFPRITRDPDELASILDEAKALAGKSLDADEKAQLQTNCDLYEQELKGIKEARGLGPAAMVVHRLTTWANFVQARYARSFAGKERRTRDLGLLAELIDDAERLLTEMKALDKKGGTADLKQGIEMTEANLKVYRTERDRIREDRRKVFGADRGTLFARIANDQFNRYRLHFANKSRVSRSPRLLQAIVDALQEILDGMQALLDDGFNTATHKKNIELVKQNLGVYKAELTNVTTARREAPLNERVGTLGGAANDVFATYREHFAGKDRKTRDLTLLADQIELLFQVGMQMDEIDRAEDDDANAKNLALVDDMLYLYHREYANVADLQKA